ncbi:MAG: AAA family ATPase [Hydrococcus sp. SU_1_0]|nr:AAA family ATPase [Hydrococcus sp. SU_1_0]
MITSLAKNCTLEDLSEITGLSYNTVLKIQERRQGVDKRSLVKFSLSFDVELEPHDYFAPNSYPQADDQHSGEKVNREQSVELSTFCGRNRELALLEEWLVKDRCRLVSVQGIGGIGKTTLCAKLVEQVKRKFDRVIWRSLRDKISLKELLIELLQTITGKSQLNDRPKSSVNSYTRQLIAHLRSHKCLIVLDDLETIMLSGKLCGSYCPECQNYYNFIKYLGETLHQSCLLLVTREKPKEVKLVEGKSVPVRSLNLAELPKQVAQEILSALDLVGDETEQTRLIEKFGGHPLALKMVGKQIHRTCDRQIAKFLGKETTLQELQEYWHQYLARLPIIEAKVLSTLANCEESPSFSSLKQELPASISTTEVIDSLESLLGRSLIVNQSAAFCIAPQLLMYINL